MVAIWRHVMCGHVRMSDRRVHRCRRMVMVMMLMVRMVCDVMVHVRCGGRLHARWSFVRNAKLDFRLDRIVMIEPGIRVHHSRLTITGVAKKKKKSAENGSDKICGKLLKVNTLADKQTKIGEIDAYRVCFDDGDGEAQRMQTEKSLTENIFSVDKSKW